jgi:hypothetical protein
MEQAILLTGMTVGGILVAPLALEWLKKFQTSLLLIGLAFIILNGMAPHFPVARSMMISMNQIPVALGDALNYGENGIIELGNAYFRLFRE